MSALRVRLGLLSEAWGKHEPEGVAGLPGKVAVVHRRAREGSVLNLAGGSRREDEACSSRRRRPRAAERTSFPRVDE